MKNERKKRPVFIDLRTDFGFKRCFEDEKVMRKFLNIMIGNEYGHIKKVTFENVEHTKHRKEQRGVTFDLRCKLDNGDNVLVEMQNYGHRFFLTRANYYLYNLMEKHLEKGVVWSERQKDIPHLIGIFILGVPMEGLSEVITQTAECDLNTQQIIWDRMRKYFISLPNFSLEKGREPSAKEIWLQTIKNLGNMVNFDPKLYKRADAELKALIDKARVSALTEEEYQRYEAELKILSDQGTAETYGYDRGKAEGIAIGKEEGISIGKEEGIHEEAIRTAQVMIAEGLSIDLILQITRLTREEINALM